MLKLFGWHLWFYKQNILISKLTKGQCIKKLYTPYNFLWNENTTIIY